MGYSFLQAFKNMGRNMRFTLASIATVTACVFLFCIFFAIFANLRYIVGHAEQSIGITVFFEESLSEKEIQDIGSVISQRPEVSNIEFTSSSKAWEDFKKEYFGDKEYLADGFEDDNPLIGSASYTIYLTHISMQDQFVEYLESIDGVRQVNYSGDIVSKMSSINNVIGILSLAIILVIFFVAVFLISNTINISADKRKIENENMRLIGATNSMIRAPFVIEGTFIGFVGATLPIVLFFILYRYAIDYMVARFSLFQGAFEFLPIEILLPYMSIVAAMLGIGMGFVVSFITIRKNLRK